MNSHHTTETHFGAQLKGFQTRMIVVAFVRILPAALALGVLAALAVAWIGGWHWTAVATLLMGGIATALVASAFVARRLAGGIAQTAATLDRRFGLANRVATAWQFATESDQMSRLIVADATLALTNRRPQDLALERPRHLGWMLAGLAVALVAFALSGSSTNASRDGTSSQSVLKGVGSAPFSNSDKRAPSSAPARSGETARAAAAATAANLRRDAAESSTELASRDDRSGRSAVASSALTEASSRNGDVERVPATQTTIGADASQGASAGRATDRKPAPGPGAGSPNALQAARAELGGASGSVLSRARTASAGGVRGGSTTGEHSDDPQHITSNARAASALAAWNRAESALAHEPLPLELRNYVRDYLIAVRPGNQP
jgi:hypothetical protein